MPFPPHPLSAVALRPTRRQALQRAGAVLLAAAAVPAWAQPAPSAPTGKVLLSVTGRVARPNVVQRADFDLAMLDALPQQQFVTRTPWYNTPKRFSGPLLRDVLAAAGATGTLLRAIALNDYKVEIPADDARQFRLLLATRMDGQPMAVRDKGPLFIIYPYDDSAELRSERYYSRSAWQLRKIDVQ